MPERRSAAELVCFGLLLIYLCWLPLPFGSVTERAQLPLIVGALGICAMAAAARARTRPEVTQSFRLWAAGGLAFIAVAALQLVPLPDVVLGVVSPQALRTWSDAERVAALAGVGAPRWAHPLSVDPETTAAHLFRLLAYFATFLAAALLIRRHRHRAALAFALGAAAVFETLYGIREAVLHRYAIWGWVNRLIYNRVFGTFVNPNHFAHYAAIVLPLGVFLAAQAWHDAAPPGAPFGRRVVRLVEKRFFRFLAGAVIAAACIAAILAAQSRGAFVAAAAGFAIVGAAASGRRHALRRGLLIAVAAGVPLLAVLYFSGLRIASRFEEPELATAGGRAGTIKIAFELWKRFPLFGTGLGTFPEMSSMTGIGRPEVLTSHAHDDYAEIAATTGVLGFLAALVPLFAGYWALMRATFGARAAELRLTWTRRAFQAAALTSITTALVHALIDFNFFIPANPATLAAIAGTAAALREPR
jgi:O-antigen ligase